jgi:hypothetical protein
MSATKCWLEGTNVALAGAGGASATKCWLALCISSQRSALLAREAIADIRAAWAELLGAEEMDALEAGLCRLRAVLSPEP